ncbi:MAG: class I SAM-dependent methyltransferase [Deltaproteobacteria bacterium]|nr:class I SAM-dependent methyltransferase [Deltaproteobacteria bacterium]
MMDIEIMERQIQGDEQKVVLSSLAASVAKKGCRFIEIGSWCGDTALILGEVAKISGGKLFCVDWWKGSPGTDLFEVAGKRDVYSFFWNRVREAGLEDTVIPVRARSEDAAPVFKRGSFDLVFIDGDHRYEAVSRDIELCSPLVREGGILCGHDCDGRMADFDAGFLEEGKDEDFFESVHCGVVLAVGRAFRDCSIDYNIWSVRAKDGRWEPAGVDYPLPKGQFAPPPIGVTRNYTLIRFGRTVYAVPRSRGCPVISEDSLKETDGVVKARTLKEALKAIGEDISPAFSPILWDSYMGFNLVRYGERYMAISRSIGEADIASIGEDELGRYKALGLCAETKDPAEIKRLVDNLSHLYPELEEEGYRGFNIVAYNRVFYAVAQDAGPMDLKALDEDGLKELIRSGRCAIAKTREEAKRLVDLLLAQKLKALERETSVKDLRIKALKRVLRILKAMKG